IHPLYDSVTMLSDVYRSRFGLLATPPVPSVQVTADRAAANGPGPGPVAVDTVVRVVADTLKGAPVPVVENGRSVIALLPLVEPVEVATVHAALRAEFPSRRVVRRAMTLDA